MGMPFCSGDATSCPQLQLLTGLTNCHPAYPIDLAKDDYTQTFRERVDRKQSWLFQISAGAGAIPHCLFRLCPTLPGNLVILTIALFSNTDYSFINVLSLLEITVPVIEVG
jgi:hypothetical protein